MRFFTFETTIVLNRTRHEANRHNLYCEKSHDKPTRAKAYMRVWIACNFSSFFLLHINVKIGFIDNFLHFSIQFILGCNIILPISLILCSKCIQAHHPLLHLCVDRIVYICHRIFYDFSTTLKTYVFLQLVNSIIHHILMMLYLLYFQFFLHVFFQFVLNLFCFFEAFGNFLFRRWLNRLIFYLILLFLLLLFMLFFLVLFFFFLVLFFFFLFFFFLFYLFFVRHHIQSIIDHLANMINWFLN